MQKYINQIVTSTLFQAVEHACKVATFIAASMFVSTLATQLQNNPVILNLVSHNSVALLIFTLTNMAFAGIVKYLDLQKQNATSAK